MSSEVAHKYLMETLQNFMDEEIELTKLFIDTECQTGKMKKDFINIMKKYFEFKKKHMKEQLIFTS